MNNIVDTLTWTKGKHTISTGINFRVMTNNKFTYSQSYPSYGFNANVAVGLGEDIQTDLTNYMIGHTAIPTSRWAIIHSALRRGLEFCSVW